MDRNVFESPALPLLLELEDSGFRMRLTDKERIHVEPGSRLTADQRQRLVAYKSAIVMLVRCWDAGVEARRDAFRVQLAATKRLRRPRFCFSQMCLMCRAGASVVAMSSSAPNMAAAGDVRWGGGSLAGSRSRWTLRCT
jgi:hypothetical protein